MASKRTERCPYKSNYCDSYISPAQYITEIFFELTSSGRLPNKFWELPQYKKGWARRAKDVHALLKKYPPEAIIKGLRDPRLKNLQSLHAKAAFSYKKVFDEYTRKIRVEQNTPKQMVEPVGGGNREPQPRTSILDLL